MQPYPAARMDIAIGGYADTGIHRWLNRLTIRTTARQRHKRQNSQCPTQS